MSSIDKIFEKYNKDDPHSYNAASVKAIDRAGTAFKPQWESRCRRFWLPVTEDSIFWTASMTKVFTAVAVMIVVERGLIALDDHVGKVVSELAEPEILVRFEDGM